MEAKVSIWFGNYFQNGNGFHFVWIQFPLDLKTFLELVSKSNGNGFHFGNMFPNQMETVSKKWIQKAKSSLTTLSAAEKRLCSQYVALTVAVIIQAVINSEKNGYGLTDRSMVRRTHPLVETRRRILGLGFITTEFTCSLSHYVLKPSPKSEVVFFCGKGQYQRRGLERPQKLRRFLLEIP